jgi:ferric-dicitrate binding protein FerR (iron transport regulator)
MTESGHYLALEEAAAWFARRHRGIMTIEERNEFDRWRRNPGNAAAMHELERIWDLTGVAGDRPGVEAAATLPGHLKLARSAVFALMCVLSVGVGILTYSGHSAFWTRLDWVER